MIQFDCSIEGELLIKTGQKVDFDTPFYKQFSKEEVHVPLAKLLGAKPKDIFKSLKKFVGDTVAKGDLVAESKGMLTKKRYISEYDGIIKEVDHQKGDLILDINTDKEDTVNAFFVGEILGIEEKKSEEGKSTVHIKLGTKNVFEYKLKEATSDFGGEVVYCKDPIKAQLTEEDVNHKLVVDDQIPSYEQVKYEALGATGFISLHSLPEKNTIHFAKLKQITDYEEMMKHQYPYVLVNKNAETIYFYHQK